VSDEFDSEEIRKKLHGHIDNAVAGDEEVLVGWVLVVETCDADNHRRRHLSVVTADSFGDAPIPPFQGRGYLTEVLDDYMYYDDYHEHWGDEDDSEDE